MALLVVGLGRCASQDIDYNEIRPDTGGPEGQVELY